MKSMTASRDRAPSSSPVGLISFIVSDSLFSSMAFPRSRHESLAASFIMPSRCVLSSLSSHASPSRG